MHYEGPIYRPPVEADTLLLQVTVGCAHNKCTYCSMYKDVCFKMEPLSQIEEDLKEAKSIYGSLERIYLVNGDPFVLKADYLKDIALKIKEYFPECKTITMYASIQNIKSKTDEELVELQKLGINDLYVGVESGIDEVLANINKGHTLEEAKVQLERLNKANIGHRALLMLGVAGQGNGQVNAIETAKFLNETKPNLIWVGTLGVFEGTQMAKDVQEGKFVEATEIENLMELKTLINNIELENVPFYGVHTTNVIPVLGVLPRDKEKMLRQIDEGIEKLGADYLSTTFRRDSRNN